MFYTEHQKHLYVCPSPYTCQQHEKVRSLDEKLRSEGFTPVCELQVENGEISIPMTFIDSIGLALSSGGPFASRTSSNYRFVDKSHLDPRYADGKILVLYKNLRSKKWL